MSKIIPRYLLKKMFSPLFKFHSNISFNKSNLKKLLPFHRQMLVSWSQYLSASPENFLKHYLSFYDITVTLTLFRMGAFGTAHRWGGIQKRSLHPKTCHTYPTMMKFNTVIPYLKKIKKKKKMNYVTHPLTSADISIFSPEICKSFYIKKYRYRLHFST